MPPLAGSATVYHTHRLDKERWLGLQLSGGAVPPIATQMEGRKGQELAFQEHNSGTTGASSTFGQVIGRVVASRHVSSLKCFRAHSL